ncbi:hypothetical protein [Demequina mangrovi]|uniref:Leucine rich repeat variant domain-containing protein n=1 Tax=Demequina mangrovi TaxID=1043493 RepID=A0A1H7A5U6_9MICO|nr:hypothetical protein [Demequina mangrovi]SEJ61049.1 hypothetical protein SAMN05421637_2386 [Demequina mangrovi]
MSWSTESLALVVTGGMLLLVVIASLHSRVALASGSRVIFLVGAVSFIAFALLTEYGVDMSVPPVVLALPLVPLGVIAVLVRRMIRTSRAARELPRPAATAFRAPEESAPFAAHGIGAERLLATSPYATATELSQLAYAHPELRPAIASNPSAPASLLQWLTEQGEPAVLAAISARGRLLG